MNKPKRHPGAAPKRFKVEGPWETAVAKSFKAPPSHDRAAPKRPKNKP